MGHLGRFPASAASRTGTWWFGCWETALTVSPTYTLCGSFLMALQEHDSSQAAVVSFNGTGVNPADLAAPNVPRVGSVFQLDSSRPGALVLQLAPLELQLHNRLDCTVGG